MKDEEIVKRANELKEKWELTRKYLPEIESILKQADKEVSNLISRVAGLNRSMSVEEFLMKYESLLNLNDALKAFIGIAEQEVEDFNELMDDTLRLKAVPDPEFHDPNIVQLSVKITPGISARLNRYSKKHLMKKSEVFLAAFEKAAKTKYERRPRLRDIETKTVSLSMRITQERRDLFAVYCDRMHCNRTEGVNAILDGFLDEE